MFFYDTVLHVVASAACIWTVCWQAGLHDTARLVSLGWTLSSCRRQRES